MDEREELAREIFITDNHDNPMASYERDSEPSNMGHEYAYNIADGLLAAGYRKEPQS